MHIGKAIDHAHAKPNGADPCRSPEQKHPCGSEPQVLSGQSPSDQACSDYDQRF